MLGLDNIIRYLQYLQFSQKQQQAFLEDLCALVEDGVAPRQALDIISKVSHNPMKRVADHISSSIAHGQGLADGMQAWFPRPVVEIIRAGEESGTLIDTLKAATDNFIKRASMSATVINSMLYPTIVFILALAVVVFVKHTVLYSFTNIKPLEQWPPVGKRLYHIGYLLETWWWLYLSFAAVLTVLIITTLRNLTGSVRHFIDQIPLLSMYRKTVAARFMLTIGLLISNGVIIKRALDMMQTEAPPYLSWHLLMMEYRLSGGVDNIADVLDTQLISREDLIRLRVMGKGKGFEAALMSLGRRAAQQNMEQINRMSRVAGALLLVITALLAMLIIFGIYNISSTLAYY